MGFAKVKSFRCALKHIYITCIYKNKMSWIFSILTMAIEKDEIFNSQENGMKEIIKWINKMKN